jgi:hypothetical protein
VEEPGLPRTAAVTRRRKSGRLGPLLGLLLAFGVAAGCSDLERVFEYAFPATVPGLPSDVAWVSLPVGIWITESGFQAQAISACFAPACPLPAVVGVFRAQNRETFDAATALDQPARLLDMLQRDERPPAPKGRPRPPVDVNVARIDEAGLQGVTVTMARKDGTRPAFGIVFSPKSRRSRTRSS